MATFKRKIGYGEPVACEEARGDYCVCKCGGILHGISHDAFVEAFNDAIEQYGEVEGIDAADLAWRCAGAVATGNGAHNV